MNTHFLLVLQPNNLGLYPYYLLKNLVYPKQNFICKWLEEIKVISWTLELLFQKANNIRCLLLLDGLSVLFFLF